ncbi:ATP-binding cassette domain-containing protein [Massilia sp. X63]|uniref:ATP-binding cassette domain-containing protein n=1 Tax=Massilia sp. X63 TaxID=3237285 RepID=UPI0034DD3776
MSFHYEAAPPVLVNGRIVVDGQDIRQCAVASVREAIGVVPQETALFNDSIGNNTAYGRSGSTRDEVVAACRAAHLHAVIDALPLKYDTPVGERGVNLSGGEKQRIAIARAVLKNPPILIFDEATSALDADSYHAITRELDRLSQDRTTLVIAHRLSTIVNAHSIVVMERGRIIEQGTHAELLRRKRAYARLWLLQQRMGKEAAR